jgi:hypothetical protein
MTYEIKDSGVREEFNTGSVRDTEVGKGMFDLLPFAALSREAVHLERGANKYGLRNWEKGQSMRRLASSMLRHAAQYIAGERTEDHLAAVVFNANALMHHEDKIEKGELPSALADLPWQSYQTTPADLGLPANLYGMPVYVDNTTEPPVYVDNTTEPKPAEVAQFLVMRKGRRRK